MTPNQFEVVVIGGGIAGIATGAHVAQSHKVLVIEREFQAGYHSTGRSAAVLHLAFENDIVHRLTKRAVSFYKNPPQGFSGLVSPLDHIAFDTPENESRLHGFLANWVDRCPWLRLLDQKELLERAPLLSSKFELGILDSESLKLDVSSILESYRKLLLERGGVIATSKQLTAIDRNESGWRLSFHQDEPEDATLLINAAGAWADEIADMAGVPRIGLQPRRRTGVIVNPGIEIRNHPMCYRSSGGLYFKPESQLLMLSPADATDSGPTDAQPDEFDVAVVIDTFNKCTKLQIEKPESTWAGLRSFVRDDKPVIGFDNHDEQFFWVAALGGFGIQTAPAYSQLAAQVIASRVGGSVTELSSADVALAQELEPNRFR